jgi:hypothetical protein
MDPGYIHETVILYSTKIGHLRAPPQYDTIDSYLSGDEKKLNQ